MYKGIYKQHGVQELYSKYIMYRGVHKQQRICRNCTVNISCTGDYINSKEYRKPDWLIKMEEIKERLAGNQPINQLINNKSINQSINYSINLSMSQSIDRFIRLLEQ